MKKISFFALAVAMVAMVACEKNEDGSITINPNKPKEDAAGVSPIVALTGMATHLQTALAFNSSVTEATNGVSKVNVASKAPARILAEENWPEITWTLADSTNIWPVTVTVDYGVDAVTGVDGRIHKGALQVVTTGFYLDSATQMTVTHKNFYVDAVKVESEKETILNEGKLASGNVSFLVNIVNGTLANDSLDVIYGEETHREFVEGVSEEGVIDTDITKHAYKITGKQTGVIRPTKSCVIKDTLSYTYEIEEGMLVTVGKMFPTEGKLKVTVANMKPADNFTLTFQGEDAENEGQYKAEVNFMGAIIPVVLSKNGSYPDVKNIDLSGMTAADKAELLAMLAQEGINLFGN